MTNSNIFIKDPSAVLDYIWDWKAATNLTDGADGDWLEAGETISTHTITIAPAGTGALAKDSSSVTGAGTSVTAMLSAGTDGIDYTVTCHIVTNQSRTDERSIVVQVRNR